jgi:hypothetical protein
MYAICVFDVDLCFALDCIGFSVVGDVDTTDRDKPTVEVRAGNLISIMVDNAACAQAQGIPMDEYLTPDVIEQLREFTLQMYFQQYGMNYNGTQDDLVISLITLFSTLLRFLNLH